MSSVDIIKTQDAASQELPVCLLPKQDVMGIMVLFGIALIWCAYTIYHSTVTPSVFRDFRSAYGYTSSQATRLMHRTGPSSSGPVLRHKR